MGKQLTSSEFWSQIKALGKELFNAGVHSDVLKGIGEAWQNYYNEMCYSPAFWQFTQKAHFEAMLQHLCRVYDKDPAALHLTRFLESIQQNPDLLSEKAFRERLKDNPNVDYLAAHRGQLDPSQLAKDIGFCDHQANQLIRNLTERRNNLLAHLNYRVAIQPPSQSFLNNYPLTLADTDKLITEGWQILNRYFYLFNATTDSGRLASNAEKDYQVILKSLRADPTLHPGDF